MFHKSNLIDGKKMKGDEVMGKGGNVILKNHYHYY